MFENESGKWISDLKNGFYKNPVLFADYSDPDVVRVDDDFFMVSSSFTYFPGIPVLHSKDLVNWKIINHAVDSMPFEGYNEPSHGKGIWAPSIRYHDNKFWVYFSTPDEGIFMVNTDDPFGKWSDVVTVRKAKGWIDPCPLWDEDNNAYIVHAFARSRCGVKSILHINKMTYEGTKIIDDGVKIFDGRINHPTLEGPKFYKRNGYYYILAPAGGVTNGWQVALRAKNIFGPYEHKIILHQGNSIINGPHQGGLVEGQNGENWFIHFQDYGAYGRITHLQPVNWVNDWPVIGIDTNNDFIGEPISQNKKPNVNCNCEISTPQTTDNFNENKIGLQWQWQAHAKREFYEIGNDFLRLYSCKIPNNKNLLCYAPNLLSQLIQAPNVEVDTKIKLNLVSDGDTAGFTITGGNYYCIRVEKKNDDFYIKQVNCEYNEDNSNEICTKYIKVDELKSICFKIKIKYNAELSFFYSIDGKNYHKLGNTVNYSVNRKSWVGGRIGLFCVNINGIESSGFSDFEYVNIE